MFELVAVPFCGSSGGTASCLTRSLASLRSCRTSTVLSLLSKTTISFVSGCGTILTPQIEFPTRVWLEVFPPSEDLLKCHSERQHRTSIFPSFLLINILMSLLSWQTQKEEEMLQGPLNILFYQPHFKSDSNQSGFSAGDTLAVSS